MYNVHVFILDRLNPAPRPSLPRTERVLGARVVKCETKQGSDHNLVEEGGLVKSRVTLCEKMT